MPKKQAKTHHDGNHNPVPRGIDSEHPAGQGKDERMASRSAPSCAGAHSRRTGQPEFPVQVDLHAGGHFQAIQVHQ